MPWNGSKLTRYVRWSYELLFSLYVALFVVDREASKEGSKFIDLLAVPLVSFDRLLSHWRDGHILFPRTDVKPELDFGVFCFFALILFVCLRLLNQIPSGGMLLVYIIIAVIVVGPLFTPVMEGRHLQANGEYEYTDAGHLHVFGWLQEFEVVLVLALICLWRLQKWSATMLFLLFAAHFVFWGLIIVGRDWQDFAYVTREYLLLPFAASMIWALYIKRSTTFDAVREVKGNAGQAEHSPIN